MTIPDRRLRRGVTDATLRYYAVGDVLNGASSRDVCAELLRLRRALRRIMDETYQCTAMIGEGPMRLYGIARRALATPKAKRAKRGKVG